MSTLRKLCSLTLGLLVASPALALDNDPRLDRLCQGFDGNASAEPCGANPAGNQAAFAELAREYGMAFAPRLLGPADTPGANGFQMAVQTGITNINEGEQYWIDGIDDQRPPAVLTTLHLDMRKGLPYSFEVGAVATWLADSEMFAFGGNVKWAPNEGIDTFPVDLALRFSLNRVVGSSQLDLTTLGGDLIVSRAFGVGGVSNIAPYMAYSPAWVIARSSVLDSTPGVGPSDPDRPDDPEKSFVLDEETIVLHRFTLGVRFLLGALNFTPEVALTKGLQSYNINLGLDF